MLFIYVLYSVYKNKNNLDEKSNLENFNFELCVSPTSDLIEFRNPAAK